MKTGKRPRGPNQLAQTVVSLATGETKATVLFSLKNPAAVELGRLGGLKGGKARARKLSKARLSAIAKKAARARWKKG